MKETGGEAHKNILLPKYVLNADLNVYEELEAPPKSLYKSVITCWLEIEPSNKQNKL